MQAARAVADGRAQALVCAGGTGAALAAGTVQHQARAAASTARRWRSRCPVPGHPVTLLDVGANAEARREHLRAVRLHGRGARAYGAGRAATARRAAVQRRGAGARQRAGASRSTPSWRARRTAAAGSSSSATSRAGDVVAGVADVIVTDGFTGNIALKLIEGVSQTMLGAVRDAAMLLGARQGRRPAAARGARRLSRGDRPGDLTAAPTCSACAAWAVVPHGRFTRRGFAQAIVRARARSRGEDWWGAPSGRSSAAGALKRPPVSAQAV